MDGRKELALLFQNSENCKIKPHLPFIPLLPMLLLLQWEKSPIQHYRLLNSEKS